MKTVAVGSLLIITLLALSSLPLTESAPFATRPKLLGVAKLTARVSNQVAAAAFYRDFLGFPDATGASRLFRINQYQFVEILPGLDPAADRLVSVTLRTDNVEALRRYLASSGWKVPRRPGRDLLGNPLISVTDPDGHTIEFVQFPSIPAAFSDRREHLGRTQISPRLMHAGIIVGDVPRAFDFYTKRLGLTEFWRGSARDSATLSWINMRLPESDDYLEFMLYEKLPAPDRRGSQHHICLEVHDVAQARQTLEARPYRAGYTRPLEVRVGVNRRRQLNLFDPDGTRTELMEPVTVDGLPPASSMAPYPPGRGAN